MDHCHIMYWVVRALCWGILQALEFTVKNQLWIFDTAILWYSQTVQRSGPCPAALARAPESKQANLKGLAQLASATGGAALAGNLDARHFAVWRARALRWRCFTQAHTPQRRHWQRPETTLMCGVALGGGGGCRVAERWQTCGGRTRMSRWQHHCQWAYEIQNHFQADFKPHDLIVI